MSSRRHPSRLVMKFGGTSVGSPQTVSQAARIVIEQSSRWEQVVVVVSAMSGVTDALTRGSQLAAAGDDASYWEISARLQEQHTAVVHALLEPASDRRNQVLEHIDRYLAEFALD